MSVTLTGTQYNENFDNIGSGLPTGWQIYTDANPSSLETPQSLTTTTATWSNTTGGFKNFAANDSGLTLDASTSDQNLAVDRALGIRQTGSFGDPGASFVFTLNNTLGFQNFGLSFKAQMLSVQPRSTTWTIDYKVGNSDSFTTLSTYTDPGEFGSSTQNILNFGTNINNQSSQVQIRISALSASTGIGSRDSFGIDDFQLTYTSVNNAPTFTIGGNQSVKAGSAQQTITGWASGFKPGANESEQTIQQYIVELVNSSDSDIFAVTPQINKDTGTLTYTPASTIIASKTAQIRVKVQDDGGTANGGVDTSAPQIFTITVNPTATNSIKATSGLDTTGTDQSDFMTGLDGNDIISGRLGNDYIFGGKGNDILYGDLENIPAYGSNLTMNDIIYGGAANDLIYGNGGDDKLYGDEGDDSIWGGLGNDAIWGGSGNDIFNGGAGKDSFVLVRGQGKDIIEDFDINEDKIAGAGGLKTFGSLSITQLGNDTLIRDQAKNQDLAILTGITANSLNASHFLAF
jgi:Ca2+-binding RTX toxin-like protein